MHVILPKVSQKSRLAAKRNPHAIEKYRFLYHFVPHPETHERAKLLSNKAITIYCLLIMLAALIFRYLPQFIPGVLGYASDIKAEILLNLTNETRERAGLSKVKINEALNKAAYAKANDMFVKGYWSHTAPDGTEPWDFILDANYDYSYAGENLAKNFNSSAEVVNAWYNSPSHRANMLNKNYTEIGFAVVNGTLDGYETTLVVQMFGKPRNATQVATVDTGQPAPIDDSGFGVIDEKPANLEIQHPPVNEIEFSEPIIDISDLSRVIGLTFGGYLTTLLIIDIWYSRRFAIPKFTGHTFAHLTFLILLVVGMWFALAPGKIL